MRNKGLFVIIGGVVSFIAGIVLLGFSGIGILLMLLGIISLIIGSTMLSYSSGSMKSDFFDNGRYNCTDHASEKMEMPIISQQEFDHQE